MKPCCVVLVLGMEVRLTVAVGETQAKLLVMVQTWR